MRSSAIQRKLSQSIVIYSNDVKEVIDTYNRLKPPSWSRIVSDLMKELIEFYNKFKDSNKQLTYIQLYFLASLLNNITPQSKTADACKSLKKKMYPLTHYTHYPLDAFAAIANRPVLSDYIQDIRNKLKEINACSDNLPSLVEAHPDVLKFLAEDRGVFTVTALNVNYCAKVKGRYQYFVNACRSIDNLYANNQELYNKFSREMIPQTHLIPAWDPVWRQHTHIEKTTYTHKDHDISKSPYKAKLDSNENIDFLLAHADHAQDIEYIFSKLHFGMIGKENQYKAERDIREFKDNNENTFYKLAYAFEQLTNEKLLNADHADLVLMICEPRFREFSDQMALAAIEYKKAGKLTQIALEKIKENPATAYPVSQVLNLLEISGLQAFENEVYVNRRQISPSVVAILNKMEKAEPTLLNSENVGWLLKNLSQADNVLDKLNTNPLTQEILQDIMQNVVPGVMAPPPAYSKSV